VSPAATTGFEDFDRELTPLRMIERKIHGEHAGLALEDMKRASPPVSKNPVQPSHSLRHLGGC
jgi:hypothetical protein